MLFERRALIAFLGYVVASRSLPAVTQPATRPPVVGVLMGFGLPGDSETKARTEAFEQGLEEEGWIVGTDLRVEYRFSEGNFDRIRTFAEELTTLRPDCILGHSTPVVAALMQVTRETRQSRRSSRHTVSMNKFLGSPSPPRGAFRERHETRGGRRWPMRGD